MVLCSLNIYVSISGVLDFVGDIIVSFIPQENFPKLDRHFF